MPWASKKQARWGNSATGRAKLGASKVKEFNDATDFKGLPQRRKEKRSRGK